MKNTQIYLQLSPATLALSGFRAPVIPLITHTDTDIKFNRITRHGRTQPKALYRMAQALGEVLSGEPLGTSTDANAARDRDGSNWTACWSKLNSNFGAV